MSVVYLDMAARWSRDLTQMRTRGPGDIENAMRAIEREYGVDYWVQWRLRYRRSALKDIGICVFMALQNAYRSECERQMRKLNHELAITKEIAGTDAASVRSAVALLEQAARETSVTHIHDPDPPRE